MMTEYQITAYYETKVRREVFVEAENEEELKEKLEKCEFADEWENEILKCKNKKKLRINKNYH